MSQQTAIDRSILGDWKNAKNHAVQNNALAYNAAVKTMMEKHFQLKDGWLPFPDLFAFDKGRMLAQLVSPKSLELTAQQKLELKKLQNVVEAKLNELHGDKEMTAGLADLRELMCAPNLVSLRAFDI